MVTVEIVNRVLFFTGTMRERGFFTADSDALRNKYDHEEYLTTEAEAYNLPHLELVVKRLPFLRYLPFIQNINVIKSDGDVKLDVVGCDNDNL